MADNVTPDLGGVVVFISEEGDFWLTSGEDQDLGCCILLQTLLLTAFPSLVKRALAA